MSEIGSNGSFVQSGGLTFLSGGASGIDTSGLIEAAVNQRLQEAVRIDVRIAENDLKSSGLTTLQDLGSTLQASLATLRGAFGVSSNDGAIFDAKAGTLTSNNTVDPTSLLNVTIDEGAEVGTNTIVVRRTAREEINTSDQFSDPAAAVGVTGTFRLKLQGMTNSNINVVATDSVQDIADKINAVSDQTGVSASILMVSDTQYRLIVRGDETGLNMQRNIGAGDNILETIGVLNAGGTYKNQEQNDRNSQIDFNGVRVTHNSNTITDIVPGVDFEIVGGDTGTTLTLSVGDDTSGIKGAIEGFVDAYNEFRSFVLTQQAVSATGEISEEQPLFGDNLMEGLSRSLQGLFGTNFTGNTGGIETLAEIGIEFDANNQLTIDAAVLDSALLDKADEVRGLFQAQYTVDNAEFNMIRNNSVGGDLSFAMDITHDGSSITSVSVGGDTSLFTVSGSSIIGAEGTVYEGVTFAYVGTTSTTVNIDFTQGFGDLAVNTLEGYVNSASGLLQREKLQIDDNNSNLTDRADRVRERAEDYRARLIEQYSSFEAQLSRSKSLIDQIRAILGTSDDS
jgi:flagellar hook-associated protein 2